MKRLTDAQYIELMSDPKVMHAMELRCEETGQHDYENCMSFIGRCYLRCKWCGREGGK